MFVTFCYSQGAHLSEPGTRVATMWGRKSSSRLTGWQIPPYACGSSTGTDAWTVGKKFESQAPVRKFFRGSLVNEGVGESMWRCRWRKDTVGVCSSGVIRWGGGGGGRYSVTPVTAHACFVYTRGVKSCQAGMAQAWSEPWLIAQVQVEFTGGLWYHWRNEWQTQNRVMEYYQEAICNAGRAWISKGCCLSEMKSSITSTSYLIRSWVVFKEKERLEYCAHTVW